MNYLRDALTKADLTVSAFASKTGVSRITAHRWLKLGWVSASHVVLAGKVLGVDPMQLTRTAVELRSVSGLTNNA